MRRSNSHKNEPRRESKSPNFFAKFKKKLTQKSSKNQQNQRKNRVLMVKKGHTWTEFLRQVHFPFTENRPPNAFETFLLENFNFKNAFNRKMVEPLGETFLDSFFCLPVFLGRFQNVKLRTLFDLRKIGRKEQTTNEVKN